MLHRINRTSVLLEKDDLMEVEQIIADGDKDQAIKFLKETVYVQIARSQKSYDPLMGTIGHRTAKHGYHHLDLEG